MDKWLILADGPSRNIPALAAGWPGTSIGVNRCCDPEHSVLHVPSYLLMNDLEVYEDQMRFFLHGSYLCRPALVFYRGLRRFCHMTYDIDFDNSGTPCFAEEGPLNLYSLNTGCLAIQWAYQMGAREIGILGMDMYYPDGDSHGCGDLRGTGSTTDANFPRGIEWFEVFQERFRGDNPRVVRLWNDDASPLAPLLDYVPFEAFAKEK